MELYGCWLKKRKQGFVHAVWRFFTIDHQWSVWGKKSDCKR